MDTAKARAEAPLRKGLYLPPLQTTFSNNSSHLFPRPRPLETMSHEEPSKQRSKHLSMASNANVPNLKRRTSRFGLAGLFSKSKPLDLEERQDKLGRPWEGDEVAENTAMPGLEAPHAMRHPSFSEEVDGLPKPEAPPIPVRHRGSKVVLRSRSSFKRDVTSKTPATWEPPPLLQAYPQAIKHATLCAPTLSAEAILRLDSDRAATDASSSGTRGKGQKDKRQKRPTTSDVIRKGDWTDKIYVLVTSGYLLQYAGQGAFDRRPEKIMPLTKDSAAFASDAIPGKYYVLQISHVSDVNGTVDSEASKSMFIKLGLRNEMKRSTSAFLLVLESPEEMSSWLVAVRKEIQAMGGKEYKADEFHKETTRGGVPQLQQKPSQRYLVKRDPNQFSPKAWEPPANVSFGDNTQKEDMLKEAAEPSSSTLVKGQSLAKRRSVDSRSISNTTSSIDQIHLDQLRESPRESFASTGAKTVSTSRGSSPGLPPVNISSEIPDLSTSLPECRPTASTYPGDARISAQNLRGHIISTRDSLQFRPAASSSNPPSTPQPSHGRTPSPAAPNFSVPTFSKRYSSAASPPALSSTTSKTPSPPITLVYEAPSPPVITEEIEVIERRTSILGELRPARKPSPRALNRTSSTELDAALSSPPPSSGSCDPPSSSEGDRPFNRRFSSLDYSRGISPLRPLSQSPSPHPPPTAALPALPGPVPSSPASIILPPVTALPATHVLGSSSRTSLLPPPMTALPAVPAAEHSNRTFILRPPTNVLPALPSAQPSYRSSVIQPQGPAKFEPTQTRQLRRPVSMQVRREPALDQPPPPVKTVKTGFEVGSFTSRSAGTLNVPSPPKPTREPPAPPLPLQQPQIQVRKSMPRIGREPPPVYSSPVQGFRSPKNKISVTSPLGNAHQDSAPHPFIPPIMVSERKFRGSLDGPWNASYGASQRNFLDLSVG
ncbi:hypothetical protein MMC28_006881 [Mycoblastus sanguinarius]|nr:hypothetical protein [Mycoblastus sanguinarius]